MSATPPSIERGAPLVGEHTREILRSIGYADGDVEELINRKIVTESAP